MKTLLIMRHAKASRKRKVRDHERPLRKRGKRDAQWMGQLLADQQLVPCQILTSAARRARKTARRIRLACGLAERELLIDDFYPGDDEAFTHALSQLDDRCERVLIVGHNPALETFLGRLVGAEHPLATSAIADVSLPIARWSDFDHQTTGTLLYLFRPKDVLGRASK